MNTPNPQKPNPAPITTPTLKENLSLPKSFSASQINWVGVIVFLTGLLGYLQGDQFIAQYPNVVSGISTVLGILIVILRFVDKQPVRLPFQKAPEGKIY